MPDAAPVRARSAIEGVSPDPFNPVVTVTYGLPGESAAEVAMATATRIRGIPCSTTAVR